MIDTAKSLNATADSPSNLRHATRHPGSGTAPHTARGRVDAGLFARSFTRIGYFLAWAELAAQIRSERRSLASLSPDQLKDLGLDSARAAGEAARPYWDIPTNRLKR